MKLYRIKKSNIDKKGRGLYATQDLKAGTKIIDYDGKGLKIWVKAIKDIKKGEEFTCDYGFGYDENYKQFQCKCKSKNCCGYIVRSESRWRIHKKFSMSNKNKLINNSR